MSAWVDAFPLLGHIDWETNRNKIASVGSGVLFFGAVWLMIDTSVAYSTTEHWSNAYFLLTLAGKFVIVVKIILMFL